MLYVQLCLSEWNGLGVRDCVRGNTALKLEFLTPVKSVDSMPSC